MQSNIPMLGTRLFTSWPFELAISLFKSWNLPSTTLIIEAKIRFWLELSKVLCKFVDPACTDHEDESLCGSPLVKLEVKPNNHFLSINILLVKMPLIMSKF